MDAAMINPFVEATLYILDTTASVKARPGVASLKTGTLLVLPFETTEGNVVLGVSGLY